MLATCLWRTGDCEFHAKVVTQIEITSGNEISLYLIVRYRAEGRAIALSSPLPFLTCGVFAYLSVWLGLHSVASTVKLAMAVWLIGPLPLILTNAAFMKLHHVFVMSYAIGWLVKLTIVALAVGWFLR